MPGVELYGDEGEEIRAAIERGESLNQRMSSETIAQAIYTVGGRGLPSGLHHHLHHRRRRRRRHRHGEQLTRCSPLGALRPIATRAAAQLHVRRPTISKATASSAPEAARR